MRILHVYSNNRIENQTKTWEAVKELQDIGYKIEDIMLPENLSYEELLFSLWTKEDIILIEQDIVPTKERLDELLNCKEILCYHFYKLRGKPLNEPERYLQVVNYEKGVIELQKVSDLMMHKGFGFTKITKEAQQLSSPNDWYHTKYQEIEGWYNLDTRIRLSFEKKGVNYHKHNYVEHNHPEENKEYYKNNGKTKEELEKMGIK